jgi:uncharacterized protein with NAD-binding domain and iron-sulfur cluster
MAKVAILGGGVAGMTAAHELIERGYEVDVYDRNVKYVGGKARSILYHGSDLSNPYKNPLPGEHGFRFFPGFYRHVTDTMKRIPYNANGKKSNVYKNLVPTSRIMIARYGLKPIVVPASFPRSLSDVELLIHDLFHGAETGLSHEEEKYFAERVWQLMTSSNSRRVNDYERLGWWEFLDADRFSDTYRSLLVEGLTRTLVAARAETASTKTGGNIFLQLLYCMLDPTVNTDRVLDGPTNDRWLIAWHDYLNSKGVKYYLGHEVISVDMDTAGQKVLSATVQNKLDENAPKKVIKADYFIMAVPVERAKELISSEMTKADPTLKYIQELAPSVSWMNGIQYYLNVDVPINDGHVICSNTAWAVTCISQIQFWKNYNITDKGNGKVRGVLSVDISDWFSPGQFTTKKSAQDCTREEVAKEVWEQLKHSFNINQEILNDDMLIDFYLDRDIRPIAEKDDIVMSTGPAQTHPDIVLKPNDDVKDIPSNQVESSSNENQNLEKDKLENDGNAASQGITNNPIPPPSNRPYKRVFDSSLLEIPDEDGLCNVEPLLVNNVNTWDLRPSASCQIPNLFFAADYVKTFTDLATMEGANEAARRAVNCLIEASGSDAGDCKVWNLKEPVFFFPLKLYDRYRWSKGLPWSLHIPGWMKMIMIPWSLIAMVIFFFQWIYSKISRI